MLYYVKPISELEGLWSVPGCLLLRFLNVIFSLHFRAPVPAQKWCGSRAGSVSLGPTAPSGNCLAKRQEGGSCLLFFPAAEGECVFCFLFFSLVSLRPVFAWVTASISFLMLRSCIRLFIDSVRRYILEQKWDGAITLGVLCSLQFLLVYFSLQI